MSNTVNEIHRILNAMVGKVSYENATLWGALGTGDPGPNGVGWIESTAIARVQVNPASWQAANARQITNSAAIVWTKGAGGAVLGLDHVAFYAGDRPSTSMLFYGAINSFDFGNNQSWQFAAGALVVDMISSAILL